MLGLHQRSPVDCPHRDESGDAGEIGCRLMQSILSADKPICVSQQACSACCISFEPTLIDWNVVIASQLMREAEQRLQTGNLSAVSRANLMAVRDRAELSLPVLLPDEDDLGASARRVNSRHRRTIAELEALLPPLNSSAAQRTLTWGVGVTTAPRRIATLPTTLASLTSCGWNELTLFIDGDVPLPTTPASLTVSHRSPQIGAWPNYLLGLTELTLRHPDADVYLMVQDDVLFPEEWSIRAYLERIGLSAAFPGLLSLYCCSDDTHDENGWHPVSPWKWGALAIIFPQNLVHQFLTDRVVLNHIQRTDGAGLVGIDIVIGDWARRNDIPVYLPTPSLVQHIGEISTLWDTSRAVGIRAAKRFIGDEHELQ